MTALIEAVLPPTEEVLPGLWVTAVPIPQSPLGYTLVYALESRGGLVMIDAGLHTPEGMPALSAGLDAMGAALTDVRGVVVTHFHPDHYGLAPLVREASGAWIGLHHADAAMLGGHDGNLDDFLGRVVAWMREAGAPDDAVDDVRATFVDFRNLMAPGHPDRLLSDGDLIDCPGWELRALHTPGHSPGHICLVEERAGVVFTGDHVLAGISPNVSVHPDSPENPLGTFLESLDRLDPYADSLALPAHKWRFPALGTRVAELRAHHEVRAEDVLRTLRAGARTVWEVASTMRWNTPWDDIPVMLRRAALGEAQAHLVLLASRGRAVAHGGSPLRWSPADED